MRSKTSIHRFSTVMGELRLNLESKVIAIKYGEPVAEIFRSFAAKGKKSPLELYDQIERFHASKLPAIGPFQGRLRRPIFRIWRLVSNRKARRL